MRYKQQREARGIIHERCSPTFDTGKKPETRRIYIKLNPGFFRTFLPFFQEYLKYTKQFS